MIWVAQSTSLQRGSDTNEINIMHLVQPTILLKGTPSKWNKHHTLGTTDCTLLKGTSNLICMKCANISIWTVLSLLIQQKYQFASNLSSPGYSCVDSLFTNEEAFGIICCVIIRLDHVIIYTSATHAILVYDVTGFFKMIVLLAMFSWLSNISF